MASIAFIIRFLGFLFFFLLAISYYHEGLFVNGIVAAGVGGLIVTKADMYPYGLKMKTSVVFIGVLAVLLMAPLP